jgi:hypothetical protein
VAGSEIPLTATNDDIDASGIVQPQVFAAVFTVEGWDTDDRIHPLMHGIRGAFDGRTYVYAALALRCQIEYVG